MLSYYLNHEKSAKTRIIGKKTGIKEGSVNIKPWYMSKSHDNVFIIVYGYIFFLNYGAV